MDVGETNELKFNKIYKGRGIPRLNSPRTSIGEQVVLITCYKTRGIERGFKRI